MDRDKAYYDTHVQDVDFDTITSNWGNGEILRKLRDNDRWNSIDIFLTDRFFGMKKFFIVLDGDDLGWLGYFIGVSTGLKSFTLAHLPEERDRTNALFEGFIRNRSISSLSIQTDLEDNNFNDLGNFVNNNSNLRELHLQDVRIGIERARNLPWGTLSISSLHLDRNNLNDDIFAVIAASLSKQTLLRRLSLSSNSIGAPSCKTLGAMASTISRLTVLHLSNNNIDDAGLEALVGGLANNQSLVEFNLSGNRSITAEGLRSLSALFSSKSCKLEDLKLNDLNIDDDGAEALADALVGNKSLKKCCFNSSTITSVGWSAFSRLLCDPSSINNTYLSHHTLRIIGDDSFDQSRPGIDQYLKWNRGELHRPDPPVVPRPQISKIWYIHRDLDMEPFFQYKLKFLPVVVGWLQSSAAYLDDGENPNIECRQLAAIFKFIRSKPQLVFDGYWAHALKETREKKRKLLLELDTLNVAEKNAMKRVRH